MVHIIFLLESTAPVNFAAYSKISCEWILVRNKKKALNQGQHKQDGITNRVITHIRHSFKSSAYIDFFNLRYNPVCTMKDSIFQTSKLRHREVK